MEQECQVDRKRYTKEVAICENCSDDECRIVFPFESDGLHVIESSGLDSVREAKKVANANLGGAGKGFARIMF